MKRAIYFAYQQRYAVVTEVCAYDANERRIDVLLFNPRERRAVEIKVSRADLLQDVNHPEKQEPWRQLTHKHYYAVPDTLLALAQSAVPMNSGIIVVTREGENAWGVRVARPVSGGNPTPRDLPAKAIAALYYRLAPLEANVKGLSWVGSEGAADAASAEKLARLQRDLEIAQGKIADKDDQIDGWKRRLAAAGPLPCAHCGAPVVPNGKATGSADAAPRTTGAIRTRWRKRYARAFDVGLWKQKRAAASSVECRPPSCREPHSNNLLH
ncbi:hypothetical protein GCM10025867_47560 (plasmid) [Frondihabitans sucicola]|uniref:MmcB family DNA repair protein n=1 Tax=Frondihabitans sucicola TaxID=1268041 RepID=A0ABM8GVM0_9MICO|nr:hypothetical protein [Frondihabitans sucicola]BDZ52515.1 hypothetical protein GCM10025867_47560 [Frondihabitans sucicola]